MSGGSGKEECENAASAVTGESLPLIGRKEFVDFPEWDLLRVRAKIDTGAYSSALDVAGYEIIATPTGPIARLRIVTRRRRKRKTVSTAAAVEDVEERLLETPVVGLVTIRNSMGRQQRRPLVEPLVRLGPVARRIRLTLTDRSRMRCRMLLGRQALAGLFLVDVSRKDMLNSPLPLAAQGDGASHQHEGMG